MTLVVVVVVAGGVGRRSVSRRGPQLEPAHFEIENNKHATHSHGTSVLPHPFDSAPVHRFVALGGWRVQDDEMCVAGRILWTNGRGNPDRRCLVD